MNIKTMSRSFRAGEPAVIQWTARPCRALRPPRTGRGQAAGRSHRGGQRWRRRPSRSRAVPPRALRAVVCGHAPVRDLDPGLAAHLRPQHEGRQPERGDFDAACGAVALPPPMNINASVSSQLSGFMLPISIALKPAVRGITAVKNPASSLPCGGRPPRVAGLSRSTSRNATVATARSLRPGARRPRACAPHASARPRPLPTTRSTGTSVASNMCWPMCTLKTAAAYAPMPELVATSSTRHPASQNAARPTGQGTPPRRSLRTAQRYQQAASVASVPNTTSHRQNSAISAAVSRGGSS